MAEVNTRPHRAALVLPGDPLGRGARAAPPPAQAAAHRLFGGGPARAPRRRPRAVPGVRGTSPNPAAWMGSGRRVSSVSVGQLVEPLQDVLELTCGIVICLCCIAEKGVILEADCVCRMRHRKVRGHPLTSFAASGATEAAERVPGRSSQRAPLTDPEHTRSHQHSSRNQAGTEPRFGNYRVDDPACQARNLPSGSLALLSGGQLRRHRELSPRRSGRAVGAFVDSGSGLKVAKW